MVIDITARPAIYYRHREADKFIVRSGNLLPRRKRKILSFFGLYLDAKAVAEEKADLPKIFGEVHGILRHFHINDPELSEVGGTGSAGHASRGSALQESGYIR